MSTSLWGQELRGPEWSQFKQDLSRRYSVEPCAAFLINSFLLTSRTDKILIRALKLSALTFIKSNHRVLRAARLSTDAYSFPALWMEVNLECMIYLAGTNRDEATTFICFSKGAHYCGAVRWLHSAGEGEWRIGMSPGPWRWGLFRAHWKNRLGVWPWGWRTDSRYTCWQ